MRVVASPARYGRDRFARDLVARSQKGAFSAIRAIVLGSRPVAPEVCGSTMVYCPYYICRCIARFQRPLVGAREMSLLGAMDAYRGDAGLALGVPDMQEVDIDDDSALPVRFDSRDAETQLVAGVRRQLSLRYRNVPGISIEDMRLLYKPAWVLAVKHPGRPALSHQWFDSESAAPIYRYDSLWPDLIREVPNLGLMAARERSIDSVKGE